MKVRIVYREDGGISVIHPAPKSRRKDETEAAWLDRVFTKALDCQPDADLGCAWEDVDESEIPTSRKYRDAWTGSKGNGISIDAVRKAEIDARPVYTKEQEKKIGKEMREAAIEKLKARDEL